MASTKKVFALFSPTPNILAPRWLVEKRSSSGIWTTIIALDDYQSAINYAQDFAKDNSVQTRVVLKQ